MTAKQTNEKLHPQFEEYSNHLRKRERFKFGMAKKFGKQMQEFTQGGMKPMDFFESLRQHDERIAEKFLLNFKHYTEFTTNQYFQEFHQLRWELGRKHKKGGF